MNDKHQENIHRNLTLHEIGIQNTRDTGSGRFGELKSDIRMIRESSTMTGVTLLS